MPEVSRFYGMVISFNWRDHPPRHFHVRYAEWHATIRLDRLELASGTLPQRALALVLEWAAIHREELEENWRRARTQEPLQPIEPLD